MMSDQVGSYQVIDLSPGRRLMINMLDLSGPAHYMYGLLEVDVTVRAKSARGHSMLGTGARSAARRSQSVESGRK